MMDIWNDSTKRETIELLSELIKIKTVTQDCNETQAVTYIKNVLLKEGIQSTIIESAPGRGNLIAKISGKGNEKPLLYLSHIDVVAADESKWDYPAFEAVNVNGTIYGRGALDTKHLTAMQIMTLILIKRNNIQLNRDLVLIVTADEEAGSKFGMEYLVKNHADLIPKGYSFNEGGGFIIEAKEKRFRLCASAEKGVCEIKVKFVNNDKQLAFLQACSLIKRIAQHKFEKRMCRVSECYTNLTENYIHLSDTLKNLLEYSSYNTLTVSKFDINQMQLPQITINYRFIPNYTQQEVVDFVTGFLSELDVEYETTRLFLGYESEIDDEFVKVLAQKSNELDEDAVLLPMVALGNTDGRFIAQDVYGYSPTLADMPFSEVLKKVHGHNECITENSLCYGTNVILQTTIALAANNNTV